VNTLESRLQAELRAESELISPAAIPPLSLPGRDGRQAAGPWRPARARRRWPGWLTPLAAAAAVLAVWPGR